VVLLERKCLCEGWEQEYREYCSQQAGFETWQTIVERIDVLEHDSLGVQQKDDPVGQCLLALMQVVLMRMVFVAPHL
jgi:hypothetical protein